MLRLRDANYNSLEPIKGGRALHFKKGNKWLKKIYKTLSFIFNTLKIGCIKANERPCAAIAVLKPGEVEEVVDLP
jgi:hypothetical protein